MKKLVVDAERFKKLVAELRVGKRLPDAVYLHAEALPCVADDLRAIIQQAHAYASLDGPWNVVKLATDEPKLSFLWYPRFFDEAFPALVASTVVDLPTGKATIRAYQDTNPPILHRKERLLPPDHRAVAEAVELTRAAERAGLFSEPREIGRRLAWEARLERLGLRIEGRRLVGAPSAATGEVHRHKTALTRYALSTPMQALWRHGFLDGEHTIFDYGCGRGDDLRALLGRGLTAAGWDPYFAKDNEKRHADVVNLGFVLNVIEDVSERREALQTAWGLARRVLVVGVLIGGRSAYERCRLFRDGVLTARGTFQKYFTPIEFREYLEAQLGREPIALAPGIAFVFRNDADEQAFLARRAASRSPSNALSSPPRTERPQAQPRVRQPKARAPTKWEVHADLADAFWNRCISLGRLPELDEFDGMKELRGALGVPATVLRHLTRERGATHLETSQEARRNDILVFLALNLFERRRSFGTLPEALRRDVKAFFGSYQTAQTEGQRLLFSAGKVEAVQRACQEAAARGLGHRDGDHSLQLHTSMADALPPVLRVYLGCAARLYGDVETADLVKLHIQSGKLSLMTYDDFDGKALPELIERVKVDLRRQQIDFFEYGTPDMPAQLLYLKSRYLPKSSPFFEKQAAFDRLLSNLPNVDLSGFGPSKDAFLRTLAACGLRVQGFALVHNAAGA